MSNFFVQTDKKITKTLNEVPLPMETEVKEFGQSMNNFFDFKKMVKETETGERGSKYEVNLIIRPDHEAEKEIDLESLLSHVSEKTEKLK